MMNYKMEQFHKQKDMEDLESSKEVEQRWYIRGKVFCYSCKKELAPVQAIWEVLRFTCHRCQECRGEYDRRRVLGL